MIVSNFKAASSILKNLNGKFKFLSLAPLTLEVDPHPKNHLLKLLRVISSICL